MEGFVYVMSNRSMPNIYKIGCTSRNPIERANDLYTTGVPTPFIVEYCIYIENFQYIEKEIHKSLINYNFNKEFFKYDLIKCILEIKRIAIQHYSYKEKYYNKHLKSQVEGWESQYLQEIENERRRKLMRAEAEKLRALEEEKKRRKEKEENDRRINGTLLMVLGGVCLTIGMIYDFDYLMIIGCFVITVGKIKKGDDTWI